jgi:hypothetical protein
MDYGNMTQADRRMKEPTAKPRLGIAWDQAMTHRVRGGATPHSTASNVPTPATSAATSKASDNTGISQVQRGMVLSSPD